MENAFSFINLKDCPSHELILLSDTYYRAQLIDSARDVFSNLSEKEQEEIFQFYKSGKFLKVLKSDSIIGFIGHGIKENSNVITIFYILLPEYRGRGLFTPMINSFSDWCSAQYPEKTHLQANTEKKNTASIKALENAGFYFINEMWEGPENVEKTLFVQYQRKLKDE